LQKFFGKLLILAHKRKMQLTHHFIVQADQTPFFTTCSPEDLRKFFQKHFPRFQKSVFFLWKKVF